MNRLRMGIVLGSLALAGAVSACHDRKFNKASLSETELIDFRAWLQSLPPGPIANFEPTASIFFHSAGENLLPEFPRAIAEMGAIGRYIRSSTGADPGSPDGGTSMVWMRDFFPIAIKSLDPQAAGKTRLVTYLSINRLRNNFTPGQRAPVNSPAIHNPFILSIDSSPIGGQKDSVSVTNLPLILEGGNIVSSGRHLFFTEHVYSQNSNRYAEYLSSAQQPISQRELETIYTANGFFERNPSGDSFAYRSPDEVNSMMAKYFEIQKETLVAMPVLPGEKTEHIDLYLLALDPHTLLIPDITPEGIAKLAFEQERVLARQASEFLNNQAGKLRTQYGYNVERLPMLPPVFQSEYKGKTTGVYFSPSNALLANFGGARKFVVLPHFEVPASWGEEFRSYSNHVESTWTSFFSARGWSPKFVNATAAGRSNGLVRCLTAQMPFLSEKHLSRFIELGY